MLTDNVRSKLSALSRRLEEIDRMLAAPETAADMNLFRDLSRERGEIEPIVGRLHAYERAESDLAAAQELAADPEMLRRKVLRQLMNWNELSRNFV